MNRWKNRVALVTGAAGDIGFSICKELMRHNIRVIGCDKNVDKLWVDAAKRDRGVLRPLKCDLRDNQEILSMFDTIRQEYESLDICINNAEITSESSLLEGSAKEFREVFDVNVLALWSCTKEAINLMRRDKEIDDGQIIEISSMLAHKMPRFDSLNFYAGTKTMVKILAEGFRKELRELKSHIRITCISPGIVDTGIVREERGRGEEGRDLYNYFQPLSPNDIAGTTIAILASPSHVDFNEIILRSDEELN